MGVMIASGKGVWHERGRRELWGTTRMFCLLIQVVTVCIYTFVKAHQEIALRVVHITVQIMSGKSFVFKGKKKLIRLWLSVP